MTYHFLMKLVVTIKILAIAFASTDELLTALFRNTLQTEHHASAERMEATVVPKVESQNKVKELREMKDEIHLNPEATHRRIRRDILSEESHSSDNKNNCGIESAPQERLVVVKNMVNEEIKKRKAIEMEYVKILKETYELNEIAKFKNTSAEMEVLRHVIKKTEDDGSAMLESEKNRADEEIAKLQKEIDNLNNTILDSDIEILKLTLKLNIEDLKKQQSYIDEANNKFEFAKRQHQAATERRESCETLTHETDAMKKNYEDEDKNIQNKIDENDRAINPIIECCLAHACREITFI